MGKVWQMSRAEIKILTSFGTQYDSYIGAEGLKGELQASAANPKVTELAF